MAILALLDLLKDCGMPVEKIATETGIPVGTINQADIRIQVQQMKALWELGKSISKDPALGLHLRNDYGKNFKHFVVSIALNSVNLFEAVKHWCRYTRLICDTDRLDLKENTDRISIVFSNLNPEDHCISMLEHDFAASIQYARKFTGDDIEPLEVRFTHAKPDYFEEYGRVVKCPVLFSQTENAIVMDKRDMNKRIVTRDPHLHVTLKKHAEQVMKSQKQPETITKRVEKYFLKHLSNGTINIDEAAFSLGMSRSTLHRKLKNEQTTFTQLLNTTRKRLSKSYLQQGLNTVQITLLLGFSDPSTFQHTFRRWYGISPGEYRKNLF